MFRDHIEHEVRQVDSGKYIHEFSLGDFGWADMSSSREPSEIMWEVAELAFKRALFGPNYGRKNHAPDHS